MSVFNEPIRHSRRVSLTPLIDVVFLLLIFFMLASTFNEKQVIRFLTPSGERASEETDFKLLEVRLAPDGTISIDGAVVQPALLRQEFEKIAVSYDEVTVLVVAEPGAPMQSLVYAVEGARSVGIRNVGMKKASDAEAILERARGGGGGG